MITRRQVLAFAATSICAAQYASARVLRPPQDAMWVWGEPILVPDRALPEFVDRRGIAILFVYVSPSAAEALLSKNVEAVEAVTLMAARGRRLYAVAGEPDWTRGVAELPKHAALLIRLAQTTRLFQGLHFDVEPNALPEWRDAVARPGLAEHTLHFYEMIRAAAPDIEIDAAVNPIFASMTVRNGNFMRLLAERVDSVSLMAYRDSVTRAIEWARPAVREIIAANRAWRMGVLAGDGEPGTSWKCASPARFMQAMKELRERLDQDFPSSRCTGFAFQDYQGLASIFKNEAACSR